MWALKRLRVHYEVYVIMEGDERGALSRTGDRTFSIIQHCDYLRFCTKNKLNCYTYPALVIELSDSANNLINQST